MNPLFYNSIACSTAHRPIRDKLSGQVLAKAELFNDLIEIALNIADKNHHKACWVLELVLEAEIALLESYLEKFCNKLPEFKHEGAIRSITKISLFCVQYHIRNRKPFLSEKQVQQITEACFDWLITDTKVASKAYAMRTLYLVGKSHDWIYPELKIILEQGFAAHSPAYKAAAREILKKINRIIPR